MLSFDKVKEVVYSELSHKIKAAREMSDKLRLHVDGVGLQSFLERINNYENELQFDARKKHAISNKFLTEELLRPVDNAFHARGGSRNYRFTQLGKEDDLIDKLVSIKANSSLSEYIEQEWFHRFVTDPNGLIFMEIENNEYDDEEQDSEESGTIEPTYKSIYSIRDYEQDGIFVKWVIFEPHEIECDIKEPNNEEKKSKIFWAVDNKYYYLYKQNKDGLSLIDSIENSFDKVPAILCSNIQDNVTGLKKSPIDSQVELLDKYLVSNSVLSIAEFFHNYLQQWTYVDECSSCNGSGTKTINDQEQSCPSCDGTGHADRKDVTDIIKLSIPDSDGTKIDPPAGYIFAPTDAWDAQINSIDRTWDIIFFSQWGTTVSRNSTTGTNSRKERETATGRILDAQPINNRLNKYSKSIEQAHTAIVNFIGKHYFPETFEKAIIQYGRRYLIETPDQIWEKYIKAKIDNAPVSTLDLLLNQFLESEFRENEQLLIYEVKKVKLEPFVHWDIITVQKLNVVQVDYYKKLYFNDWIQTLETRYVIDTDIKKLNEELTMFATAKIPVVEPIINIANEKV